MLFQEVLLILFGFAILLLLFLVAVMQRRINQLLRDVDRISGRMRVTSTELEALTKNVEEIKKLKF
jgi:hypothetical protein